MGTGGGAFQPLTTYSMAGRLDISDVVSYHSYTNYDKQKVAIASYKKCLRPVICTEWMARPLGSRWTDLALFKQEGVGCYNWGLVNGRTQCQFSWRSKPGDPEPEGPLAIGSGSLFFNYANHAGFWLVKESFAMTMGEATLTISVIQSIVAVVGLAMVLLLNLLPALS